MCRMRHQSSWPLWYVTWVMEVWKHKHAVDSRAGAMRKGIARARCDEVSMCGKAQLRVDECSYAQEAREVRKKRGAASGGKGDGPSERRESDMMGVDVRASRSDMQVDW
jgi:hypothetical protein